MIDIVTDYDTAVAETPLTTLGASLAGDLYLDNLGSEFPIVRRELLTVAMTQFADTAAELPRPVIDLADLALSQSTGEQIIVLDALHDISRANPSNLATRYLSERQTGMSSLAKQARMTLAGGRKYIRPEQHTSRSGSQGTCCSPRTDRADHCGGARPGGTPRAHAEHCQHRCGVRVRRCAAGARSARCPCRPGRYRSLAQEQPSGPRQLGYRTTPPARHQIGPRNRFHYVTATNVDYILARSKQPSAAS